MGEKRRGTAHKFCDREQKLLMPAEAYYKCRSLHDRSCYLDPRHQLIHGSCHAIDNNMFTVSFDF